MNQTTVASQGPELTQIALTQLEMECIRSALENYKELIQSPTSADRDARGTQWADEDARICSHLLNNKLSGNCVDNKLANTSTAKNASANMDALSTFLTLLATSDTAILGDNIMPAWKISRPCGVGDNQVVHFTWTNEQGQPCSIKLTEEGILDGKWANAQLLCTDDEGTPISIGLRWQNQVITPDNVV